MEQKNFQNNLHPPRSGKSYSFWGIWGPVIINWMISFATGFVAASALAVMYFASNQELVYAIVEDEALKAQFAETIYSQYYDYSTIIQGVASLIAIPIMYRFYKIDRIRLKAYEPVYKSARMVTYIETIVMFVTACFVMNSFIILGNLSAYSEEYVETMEAFYTAPLFVQILSLGIIVPVCEELVFRGLVFKRLRAYESYLKSAFGSAVIFSIVHGNFVQVLYAFCLGMMLAYSYEKLGTILAPIIGHAVMNIFSVLATEYELFEYLMHDFVKIATVTVLCTAISATMYVLIKDTEMKIEQKEEIE